MAETKIILKFGDPDSIAVRDRFIENEQKKHAKLVKTDEEIREYSIFDWTCPFCGFSDQINTLDDDVPHDNLVKCHRCKKWLKLDI